MTSVLDSRPGGEPALWLEVAPPRGINAELMLAKLRPLREQVEAVNLVDNALGRVKMSSLVFASMVKARCGIPVAINVSCRDRNRFAIRSDLLGAAALGIDAVIALQGDKLPPDGSAGARPVHDLDTFGLLRMIGDLNRGDTGEGKPALKMLPRLLTGVVGNPNRDQIEREFELLQRKAEAGARFVITQPVFDRDTALRFAEQAHRHGLKVFIGILPVKRAAMAQYMKEKIKDLSGATHHLDRYSDMSEEDTRRASIEASLALMEGLADTVAGFNIMSGGGPSLAIELVLAWRRRCRREA
jgi:5,10-methylenetetrahydrofolate reductase